MDVLALIIALVALAVALAAFARTGGIRELRGQVQTLNSTTDAIRDRTADALNRLEHLVRGKERSKSDGESEPSTGGDAR